MKPKPIDSRNRPCAQWGRETGWIADEPTKHRGKCSEKWVPNWAESWTLTDKGKRAVEGGIDPEAQALVDRLMASKKNSKRKPLVRR